LPLEVVGEVPRGWQAKLSGALEDGVRQGQFEVAPPAGVGSAVAARTTCRDIECYRAVARTTGTDYIIRAELTAEARNYTLSLELVDPSAPDRVVRSLESCQLCGLREVEDLLRAQASALEQKAERLSIEPARIGFETRPAGASISIDGELVGTSPAVLQLPPGRHSVTVAKDGFIPQERSIDAVRGTQESVVFELLREPTTNDDSVEPTWKRPARIAGWASLGLGVAAIATGATFFAVDGRPYRAECSGLDVDDDGDCRRVWQTTRHGAVFVAIGAALVATGVGLVVGARKKSSRRSATNAASLRASPVGLAGRF
jgi:hypothetical protein